MIKYLLPKDGNFYKANLHCHTTFSDGKKTPEEVKEIYKSLGYSVVAYTDHDILIPHDELTDESFVALHGYEMETNEKKPWAEHPKTCHVCFIGIDKENITQPFFHRTKYLIGNSAKYADAVKFDESTVDYERVYTCEELSRVMQAAREKGFFVTYNHPTWSLEDYRNYSGYRGMNAMELLNGSCICAGFDDNNPRVYDDILRTGNRIFAVAGDDNHNGHELPSRKSDSGWAFTMIKAPKLEYSAITEALVKGNCYASEGPEIYDLWYEDGKVHITTSEADRINCNYGIRRAERVLAEGGVPVTEATFTVPENCVYFRITVVDKTGKRAYTSAYFVDELMEDNNNDNN